MYIPPGDLYQLAKVIADERQSDAARHRAIRDAKRANPVNRFERFQRIVVFIGTALLPLGESLRRPLSDPHPRSLDIQTQ